MRTLALLFAAVLIQGCAFTDAQLNIAHRPSANFKGPLTSVESTSFELKPLQDNRADRARIGWKKNGYGQNTADITATRDVGQIVADAVTAGLQRNGHKVGVPSNIVVTGTVTRFWFETDVNFWTVEFIGNVDCDLVFSDAKTGAAIHKSRYSGTFAEKKAGGLEATWTEVMNTAVEKMVEDVVFDTDLIEALESRKTASR